MTVSLRRSKLRPWTSKALSWSFSACDTGLGDIVNGDGVYALRRAFEIAGAQHEMMSLWKVDDLATSQLMSDFYDALARGASPQQALRAVQRRWTFDGNRQHPFYWAGLVISGL